MMNVQEAYAYFLAAISLLIGCFMEENFSSYSAMTLPSFMAGS